MEEWAKKHLVIFALIMLTIGALFFAGPIALVVVKIKELAGKRAAVAGAGNANAQNQIAAQQKA